MALMSTPHPALEVGLVIQPSLQPRALPRAQLPPVPPPLLTLPLLPVPSLPRPMDPATHNVDLSLRVRGSLCVTVHEAIF